MIIVFDLRAAFFGLLALAVVWPLALVLSEGSVSMVFFAAFTALSFYCQRRWGAPGRLYYLPAWVVGAAGLAVSAVGVFGHIALSIIWAVISVGALVLVGALVRIAIVQIQTARYAPTALSHARRAATAGDTNTLWEELPRAFFRPLAGRVSPLWGKHDIEALEIAIAAADGRAICKDTAELKNMLRALRAQEKQRGTVLLDTDAMRRTARALFSLRTRMLGTA